MEGASDEGAGEGCRVGAADGGGGGQRGLMVTLSISIALSPVAEGSVEKLRDVR